MPRDPGEMFGNSFGRDDDHSRELPAGRTRGSTPAAHASHTRTAPTFLDFFATATTDQGRVRSFDRPHLDADGCDSPCERGTDARNRSASRRRDRGADQVRRHPPRPAIPDTAATPGGPAWTTGRGALQPGAGLVPSCDSRSRPAGSRWPPASREPLTVRPVPLVTGQISVPSFRRWPVTAGAASVGVKVRAVK
jgi:hypothetical protein